MYTSAKDSEARASFSPKGRPTRDQAIPAETHLWQKEERGLSPQDLQPPGPCGGHEQRYPYSSFAVFSQPPGVGGAECLENRWLFSKQSGFSWKQKRKPGQR